MRRGARHRKRRATPLATKSARPLRVGHIDPPGALRRLPAISESRTQLVTEFGVYLDNFFDVGRIPGPHGGEELRDDLFKLIV